MCGFAGIFRIDNRTGSEDAAAVRRMIDAQTRLLAGRPIAGRRVRG
jgi:hypothetical protein